MKHTLCLFLFVFLFGCTQAKQAVFNTTYAGDYCIDQCWFLDPNVWENNLVPETNDTVLIVNSTLAYISIFFNTSLSLSSLTIEQQFGFYIINNARLNVSNLSLWGNSMMFVQSNSILISQQNTFVLNGSILNIAANFAQDGNTFLVDHSSTVNLNLGYFGLHSAVSMIHGRLIVLPGTLFYATGNSIQFANQVFTFRITPTLFNPVFVDSSIVFSYGIGGLLSLTLQNTSATIYNTAGTVDYRGVNVDEQSLLILRGIMLCNLYNPKIEGILHISTSYVNIVTGAYASPLIIGGHSTLNTSSLELYSVSYTTGEQNEPASVIFSGDSISVFEDITIPGSIYANSIFLTGNVLITGNVTAAKTLFLDDANIAVNGDVQVGYNGDNVLVSNSSTCTFEDTSLSASVLRIGDNGTFGAEYSTINATVFLHQNSTLRHHNSSFIGAIFNNGIISIRSQMHLTGNYTQGSHGTLVSILDLANRSSGYVNVVGYAHIQGLLSYDIEQPSQDNKKMQLAVVQTTEGVTGIFSSYTNVGLIEEKHVILYSANDIYLVFGVSETPNADSLWWVWIIIALGAVAVFALIIFLVFTLRRRNYSPINGANNN